MEMTKYYNNMSVISIVNQIALAKAQEKAFEELKFECYLNKNCKDANHLIVTLESLTKFVNKQYDIIFLDEITTTLMNIMSPTMNGKRKTTLNLFYKLIKNAKHIFMCDAIITDATIEFIKQMRNDIFFYRNVCKKSSNITVEMYHSDSNDTDKKIIIFIKPLIENIKKNKNCCIMSDTKKYVTFLGKYLSEFCKKEDMKIYSSDEGNANEIYNCNDEWENKLVLYSPKITHGVDCQLKYEKDCVYVIYSGKSINSFYMLQQIGRLRKCTNIKILWITKNYAKNKNHYITFEETKNKLIEQFNNYISSIKELDDKMEIITDLASSYNEKHELMFSEKKCSLFVTPFFYNEYYDRLFKKNKYQAFTSLITEQGYKIIDYQLNINENKDVSELNIKDIIIEHDEMYNDKIKLYLHP